MRFIRPITYGIAALSVLLVAIPTVLAEKTLWWNEPLISLGGEQAGQMTRSLTYAAGAPERESFMLELGAVKAKWTGSTDNTPRAIVLANSRLHLVTIPWLARGDPTRRTDCFDVLQYENGSGAWTPLPASQTLASSFVYSLVSPSTFLTFDFPAAFSPRRQLHPTAAPSGALIRDSYDRATIPSLDDINNKRCNSK